MTEEKSVSSAAKTVNKRGSRCQDVKHKEQESFGLKKLPGKLNSVWDPVNAELSDVVEYLDKFNDVCVAKVTPDDEKQQRCAAESLREFKGGSRRLCPFCLRAHCWNGHKPYSESPFFSMSH